VTVEYSPVEKQATVIASYGGERFDPAEGGNELSYNVLKSSVEDLSYEIKNNQVTITDCDTSATGALMGTTSQPLGSSARVTRLMLPPLPAASHPS